MFHITPAFFGLGQHVTVMGAQLNSNFDIGVSNPATVEIKTSYLTHKSASCVSVVHGYVELLKSQQCASSSLNLNTGGGLEPVDRARWRTGIGSGTSLQSAKADDPTPRMEARSAEPHPVCSCMRVEAATHGLGGLVDLDEPAYHFQIMPFLLRV